jgi:Dyp-type peroxidase family
MSALQPEQKETIMANHPAATIARNDTTPLQLVPTLAASSALNLREIQGDILIGLQKKWERFVFFSINDVAAFKRVLRSTIAPRITTTELVHQRELLLQTRKMQGQTGLLPLVGVNIGFAQTGIQTLLPGVDLADTSFVAGGRAQASAVGDPVDQNGQPTTWAAQFLSATIHGVLLITGGTEAEVDAEWDTLRGFIGGTATVTYDRTGNIRPGAAAGHEHFGWQDGISQPGVNGLTTPFPGQQMVDPGLFVLGYPGGGPDPLPLPWMRNGSFMVFRQLQQLVPEFDAFILSAANELGVDPVLLGARLVGRWKSGAPLALTPSQDDLAIATNPQQNNDFDFADDQAQRRCPFGAHVRKTNPRADIPETGLTPHRIMRQGIPFGPEVSAAEHTANRTQQERGLMFVCYQTIIPDQFEFVQGSWANNPTFVSDGIPPFVKNRPGGLPSLPVISNAPIPAGGSTTAHDPGVIVGFDPVIGQQQTNPRTTDEPFPNYPTGSQRSTLVMTQNFIVPKAGAYFFVPSISALTNELSVPPA